MLNIIPWAIFINSFLSGIIWLLVIGDWKQVLYGFIVGLIATLAYYVICFPSALLALGAVKAYEQKRKIIGNILVLLDLIYDYAIFAFWIYLIFNIFIMDAVRAKQSPIPYLLYGYSIMMVPFVYIYYFKEKEKTEGSRRALYYALFVYLFLSICWLLNISPGVMKIAITSVTSIFIIVIAVYYLKIKNI